MKVENLVLIKRSYRSPPNYVDYESKMVIIFWTSSLVYFNHVLVSIHEAMPNHITLIYKFDKDK